MVFECSGRGEAAEAGLDQLDYAATLVFVGTSMNYPRVNHNRVIILESTIIGAYNYDAAGWAPALELLASGKMPLDELIEPDDVLLDGLYDVMQRCAKGRAARQGHDPTRGIRRGGTGGGDRERRTRVPAAAQPCSDHDGSRRPSTMRVAPRSSTSTATSSVGPRATTAASGGTRSSSTRASSASSSSCCRPTGASTGNNVDHFGLQVSTCEEIEDIVDRATKRQASDDRVSVTDIHSRITRGPVHEYTLTSAYIGFKLPLTIELQNITRREP